MGTEGAPGSDSARRDLEASQTGYLVIGSSYERLDLTNIFRGVFSGTLIQLQRRQKTAVVVGPKIGSANYQNRSGWPKS